MKIMKMRDKNPVVRGLIEELMKASAEQKAPVWAAVARGLNRPRRKGYSINLETIHRVARPKETVVVPGTVLSRGEARKGMAVAALRFSAGARGKIEKAGGRALGIGDVLKDNPKGRGVRIMG